MTGALLDTHAFIWWLDDDRRLSRAARDAITAAGRVIVTDVSLWEMAIKQSVGKFTARPDVLTWFENHMTVERFAPLAIDRRHLARTAELPFHHRDPFDRLLVAQAHVEQLPIVTNDRSIVRYDVETIW